MRMNEFMLRVEAKPSDVIKSQLLYFHSVRESDKPSQKHENVENHPLGYSVNSVP